MYNLLSGRQNEGELVRRHCQYLNWFLMIISASASLEIYARRKPQLSGHVQSLDEVTRVMSALPRTDSWY